MTPAEIKTALAKKGFNQADIARALEINPTTVCSVINGRFSNKRLATAICKILGEPAEVVFPDNPRYHTAYKPIQSIQHRTDELRQLLAS